MKTQPNKLSRLNTFFKYLVICVTITKLGVEFNVYGDVKAYTSNFRVGSHERTAVGGALAVHSTDAPVIILADNAF